MDAASACLIALCEGQVVYSPDMGLNLGSQWSVCDQAGSLADF